MSRPREWLVDWGSCFDVVDISGLDRHEWSCVKPSDGDVTRATDNGLFLARNTAVMNLGPPFGDCRAGPIVLRDSPPVLSMVRMVTERGFTFHWGPDDGACLIMLNGRVCGVDVRDNVLVMPCPARWLRSRPTADPRPKRIGPWTLPPTRD